MVFSAVKAHQFFAEESWDSFKQIFDTYMCEASKVLLLIVVYILFWDVFYYLYCPFDVWYTENLICISDVLT